MDFQQPNQSRLVVRLGLRGPMWDRMWRWLLSPPSRQPDSLQGELCDNLGELNGDEFLDVDSQVHVPEAPESTQPRISQTPKGPWRQWMAAECNTNGASAVRLLAASELYL